MKFAFLTAAAITFAAGSAQAASYAYDFKTEANASGQIGEAIFSEFNTSTNGVYVGPNLSVTASKGKSDAFVYFDNGDAGIGVCGVANGSVNQYNPGSGANLCNPSSDDGLSTQDEALYFTATDGPVRITSFLINSNHDSESIWDTVWNIHGETYDNSDFIAAAGGDVLININVVLGVGESLALFGETGPNSYISGMAVSSVPLPAAGILLLAGIGGLGALRARRKS